MQEPNFCFYFMRGILLNVMSCLAKSRRKIYELKWWQVYLGETLAGISVVLSIFFHSHPNIRCDFIEIWLVFFSLESKTILPIRKMSILSVGLHHIKDYHQFVLLLNVFKHSPSIFFWSQLLILAVNIFGHGTHKYTKKMLNFFFTKKHRKQMEYAILFCW